MIAVGERGRVRVDSASGERGVSVTIVLSTAELHDRGDAEPGGVAQEERSIR